MLRQHLDQLAAAGLYRSRRVVERSRPDERGVRVVVDGRDCLAFCSNDYLALAQDPRVAESLAHAAREYGLGSGASHLVSGHHSEHHALEEALARFTGRARALLFSTGYMANLGVVTALARRGDTVFEDRLNHASLLDAGLLSGARFSRFPHLDPAALEARLAAVDGRRSLVLTDGVFSMDGDIAPLPALARSCARHGARLIVDDAHGLGVLGAGGRGALEHHDMTEADVPVLVGTLGKAFGSFGAFVAGSEELIEYLVQRARTYVYTTALPPAIAAATRRSLELAEAEPWRRARVLEHSRRFRALSAAAGIPLMPSATPIQPVLVGDARAAVAASEALLARGILVTAIRPPTVPEGASRLRITFSAGHSEADVERLVTSLAEALAELPAAESEPPAAGPTREVPAGACPLPQSGPDAAST